MDCPHCGGELEVQLVPKMGSIRGVNNRQQGLDLGVDLGVKKGADLGSNLPEKGGEKGDILSGSDPVLSGSLRLLEASDLTQTQARVRGKSRAYSAEFEACWKLYGRKEEKPEAFVEWIAASRQLGGEKKLGVLVSSALAWQTPFLERDGWKFAIYFRRYLKRRRWEDEPPVKSKARDPFEGMEELDYLSQPR